MKPITSGFCALAAPVSPSAAAPAALPSSARRPSANLSIIAVPSAFPMPPVGRLEGQSARGVPVPLTGFPPAVVCNHVHLHYFWASTALWHPICMQSGMQAENPTLAEKLSSAIADGILDGTLRPGERLDELSLAQQHGVSRTPVPEALRQLN